MNQSNYVNENGIPEENYVSMCPPIEAYLYFPSDEDCKYNLGKQKYRRIFDGQIELDNEDKQYLEKFCQEISQKKVELNNAIWTPSQILRVLQATQFKYDQTLTKMQEYEKWFVTLPQKLESTTKDFLNSGIIYFQGRDHKFRPIFILNANKLDLKVMAIEQYISGLTYFLEVVLQAAFLPGQIENWVILMDLDYMTVGLPLNALKSVLGYLQNNYRSRLYKMYLIKTSMALSLFWRTLKPFMEENTVQKINFCKETAPEIFTHTNKAQLELKHGGSAPNKENKQYWPPLLNNKDISIPTSEVKLISKQGYHEMFVSGKLSKNKISQQLLEL